MTIYSVIRIILLTGACLAYSQDIRDYFSTKRNYPIPQVHHCHDFLLQHKETRSIFEPACQLVQVQLLSRHGTRNPTFESVESCLELERYIRSQDQRRLDSFLGSWSCPFSLTEAGKLTDKGIEDMMELAERAKQRYSSPLIEWKSSQVRATKSHRVIQSTTAFLSSFFTSEEIEKIPINMTDRYLDDQLSFYKSCPAYYRLHSNDCLQCIQWSKKIFPDLISKLQHKTGLLHLTVDHLITMREICLFQNAINGTIHHGFCDYFEMNDLELLAYADDLHHQEYFGFAHRFHRNMTCSFYTHLLDAVKTKIKDPSSPSVYLNFGHAETIIPILVALDVFKDESLLRSDTATRIRLERKWLMSRIAPFAANVWFELYSCPSGHHVRILHNEIPVKLSFCDLYCPLDLFRNWFLDILDCDFELMCKL